MSSFDVQKLRKDFPNLNVKVHGKPLVYLDNAATTMKPQSVIDAIRDHLSSGTSNVHRGVHLLSEQATASFEETRETVRHFINASSITEIIFTKGATDSLNLLASSLGQGYINKGDEILISHMEHHSNIVPWQLLCERIGCVLKVIPINQQGEIIVEEYLKLLSNKTKIVSIVWVSNSLGTVNPVKLMIDAAHKHGARVIIDAAQAITHTRIDVKHLDCDFLVFSGHKVFGPTGVGVLYGKEQLLEQLPPYQGGGDMIKSVSFTKTTFNSLPYKFEAGTPAIAEVIGLKHSLRYLLNIDWKGMQLHKENLLNYATKKLQTVDGLTVIGIAKEKTSIVSFVLNNIHPHDLGTLVDQEGVAIRTGHHCTQPIMEFFKIPATARASFAFYNTTQEVDVLVESLIKAQKIFNI